MVDSEYGTDDCKSSRISIRIITKIPDMPALVPDHLKTKKMCNHPLKKNSFVIRYVSDRYNTQQMCDKAVLENAGTLESVDD